MKSIIFQVSGGEEVARITEENTFIFRGDTVIVPIDSVMKLRWLMQNTDRAPGTPKPGSDRIVFQFNGEPVLEFGPGGVQIVRGVPATNQEAIDAWIEWTEMCWEYLKSRLAGRLEKETS